MTTWQTEFPDFPAAGMPAIPPCFTDRSWHNEAMPCFIDESCGIVLWVDYPDSDGCRFTLQRAFTYDAQAGWQFDGSMVDLFETDDWATVLRSLPNFVRPALAETYKRIVGYDPFADEPAISADEVAETLLEVMRLQRESEQ